MGVRMSVHGVDRDWLERLMRSSVAALAARLGGRVEREHRRSSDEPRRFTVVDPRLLDPVLHDVVDPDVAVGTHLRDHGLDLRDLLRAFEVRGEVRAALEGHRRWWVGSLAHTLGEYGFRRDPTVGPAFARLRGLTGTMNTACSWFDAIEPALWPEWTATAEDGWCGAVELSPLMPLLDAASAIERFEPPPGPLGIAPDREDTDAWTDWVSGNVRALRGLTESDLVISTVR